MANKKQTAVEWLIEKLNESGISLLTEEIEILNQAIEMHKDEIIRAWACGATDGYFLAKDNHELVTYTSPKQYYNETYGGKND